MKFKIGFFVNEQIIEADNEEEAIQEFYDRNVDAWNEPDYCEEITDKHSNTKENTLQSDTTEGSN